MTTEDGSPLDDTPFTDAEPQQLPTESPPPPSEPKPQPSTIAAYNRLLDNVTEAAKQARNQMIALVFVDGYGLVTLATLKDVDFFERGKGVIGLPLIGLDVPLIWYLPSIAVLSIVVFGYFHFYLQRAWQLAKAAENAAEQHRDDPAFVPPDGLYRYPWIAFAAAEPGAWNRVASLVFGIVQWAMTPALLVACSMRTVRLGAGLEHWISIDMPWHWPLTATAAVMSVVAAGLAMRAENRRSGKKSRSVWAVALLSLLAATYCVVRSAQHPLQLQRAKLGQRKLYSMDLRRADLTGAHLEGAYLSKARLQGARLWHADLETAILWNARLDRAWLRGAHLDGASLNESHLEGAILIDAHLEGANLFEAHLDDADLRGADLRNADLSRAGLEAADLLGADLLGADLHDADLLGTRNLTQAQLDGACGGENTKLPDGLTIKPCDQ